LLREGGGVESIQIRRRQAGGPKTNNGDVFRFSRFI